MPLRARVAEGKADLSDWSEQQTRLVRAALLGYQARTVEGRRKLSWAGVQGDIKDVTGVDMGGKDTLRQFVEGGRSGPLAERRAAIVAFLTHPEVDALSIDEWLEPDSPYHAPNRLLDYLKTETDPPGVDSPLHCLCGSYRARHDTPEGASAIALELSALPDERILKVEEVHDLAPPGANDAPGPQARARSDRMLRSRKESAGWCILTPEDNILFFMKEKQYGANHYYQLICDINIWLLDPPKLFVLLRSDNPPLVDRDAPRDRIVADQAMRAVRDGAIVFHRADAEKP